MRSLTQRKQSSGRNSWSVADPSITWLRTRRGMSLSKRETKKDEQTLSGGGEHQGAGDQEAVSVASSHPAFNIYFCTHIQNLFKAQSLLQ